MYKFILAFIFLIMFNPCKGYNFFTNPKKPSAKLILVSARSTSSLSPVTLLAVNGKEIIPRNIAVWLKPGTYNLKFSSIVSKNGVNSGSGISRNNKVNNRPRNELNVTLENNKIYYIAFDSHSKDYNKWQYVIWKTESN